MDNKDAPLPVNARLGEDEDWHGNQEADVDREVAEKRDLELFPVSHP
jgi:hypothetical protein